MKFTFPYWYISHIPKTNVGAVGEAKASVIHVTIQIILTTTQILLSAYVYSDHVSLNKITGKEIL
jgi:hypothetical protein